MAAMVKGNALPSISPDYYMAGATTTVKGLKKIEYEKFVSRAERIEDAEKHFARAYKQETGNDLPQDAKGIVVIQLGQYPYGREIYLNPAFGSKASVQAIDIAKPIHMPYVFFSKTYFLEKGILTPLLDCRTALCTRMCHNAVHVLTQKMGWTQTYPVGPVRLKTGKEYFPYWAWQVETADGKMEYLLLSIMNGGIFFTDYLRNRQECPDRFYIDSINFAKIDEGWKRL